MHLLPHYCWVEHSLLLRLIVCALATVLTQESLAQHDDTSVLQELHCILLHQPAVLSVSGPYIWVYTWHNARCQQEAPMLCSS